MRQKHNSSVEIKETINWLLLWKHGCWETFQNPELEQGCSEGSQSRHWLYYISGWGFFQRLFALIVV